MKKGKLLKRGLASLLAAVLAVGLQPMMPGNMSTVKAADGDKKIAGLGTSVIANPTEATTADEWQGSYVYFGTYDGNPVKYRVLDNNTSVFGGTTMLLDCDSILWAGNAPSSAFDANNNIWPDSSIRTYLNETFLTSSFFPAEQSAIAKSTKSTAYIGTVGADGYGWYEKLSYVPLNEDKIFFLDAKEATNTSYGYSNIQRGEVVNRKKTGAGSASWWLRSAVSVSTDRPCVGYALNTGEINYTYVDNTNNSGVSPAFNINLSSVLFASVISGKAGETEAEYKLTLLDSNMTITGNGDVTRSGDMVTVPYTITGANSANATRVSVLITDKAYTDSDAKILHYDALDKSAGNGTGTFTLPSSLSDKECGRDYYAYIIAEDVNGEKATDYASTPVSITVPASKSTVTPPGTNTQPGNAPGTNTQPGNAPGTNTQPGNAPGTNTQPGNASGTSTQPGNASGTNTQPGNAENTTPAPDPVKYDILDGADSSWTQNTDGSLSIRGSGAFSKFVGVKVDGTLVDAKNYTVKEGSTIITLKTDYLNTISAGTHTFEMLWTDGAASTTLALKADTSEDGKQKDDVPKTGDDTPIAWMFMLSILSGIGLIITAKKRRVNPDSSKR